jgi:hydroxyacylglutathione hydrolase
MRKLSNDITIFYSFLWQTTTTLIRGKRELFLFDPNYHPQEIKIVHQAVAEASAGIDKENRYLIFTHSDWDHIVGYPSFIEWQTISQHQLANKSEQIMIEILNKIHKFDADMYIDREIKPLYPHIHETIEKEKWVDTSDDKLYFLATPGHTADGLTTFFTNRGVVVAGDMLSKVEFPFIFHSAKSYIESLDQVREKVKEFEIHTLISGHGEPAESKQEIEQRITQDMAYITTLYHEVTKAVQAGNRGAELVDRVKSQAILYARQEIPHHLYNRHLANIEQIGREVIEEQH